ncbi:hypothetical protein B0H14DRAFT_2638652 [Mycena olivaceomarginata]|nr:hypothetical protein B0H14DRAFT_2638652 [Mycena olivaceomarginata]
MPPLPAACCGVWKDLYWVNVRLLLHAHLSPATSGETTPLSVLTLAAQYGGGREVAKRQRSLFPALPASWPATPRARGNLRYPTRLQSISVGISIPPALSQSADAAPPAPVSISRHTTTQSTLLLVKQVAPKRKKKGAEATSLPEQRAATQRATASLAIAPSKFAPRSIATQAEKTKSGRPHRVLSRAELTGAALWVVTTALRQDLRFPA